MRPSRRMSSRSGKSLVATRDEAAESGSGSEGAGCGGRVLVMSHLSSRRSRVAKEKGDMGMAGDVRITESTGEGLMHRDLPLSRAGGAKHLVRPERVAGVLTPHPPHPLISL